MTTFDFRWLAAVPRWLDPLLWQDLRQLAGADMTPDWETLVGHLEMQSGARWRLPTRDHYLSEARTTVPERCQQWHAYAFEHLRGRHENADALYHFEQAGNLCLARLAYDDLASLLARAGRHPLDIARFSHLVTYFSAVLAVERHQAAQAEALLHELRSRPDLDADIDGRAANTLGVQAYHQARYDASFRYYEQALARFRELENGLGQLRALINLAILHNQLGQFERAIERLEGALTWTASLSEAVWESWILNELGINFKDLGRWDAALDAFQQALASARALKRQRGVATALGNLGELYLLLGRQAEAEAHYLDALNQAASPLARIEILGNLGLLRQLQDRPAEAGNYFRQALQEATALPSVSYQALAHYRLGILAWQQADPALARQEFEQAVHVIEALRSQVQTEDVRIALFGGWQQVYQALFLVALEQNDAPTALTVTERARARAFLDLLSGRDTAQPDLGEPLAAAAIQAALPADVLLLIYFSTSVPARFQRLVEKLPAASHALRAVLLPPDRTVLLLVTQDEVTAHPLALNATTLARRTFALDGRNLTGLTPSRQGSLEPPWVLSSLGPVLLGPAADRLSRTLRVAIVPHGPLHYVPFTALQHSDGRDLFPAAGGVLLAPSATVLLAHCRRPQPPAPDPALVFGYAPDLRHAEAEARMLCRQLNGELKEGRAAVRAALVDRGARARILHLSCHGTFDAAAPLQSGLHLADGLLTAADLLARPPFLRAELVTVSACESGRSGLLGGDELLGLVRAFLYAGTPSILVSLWAVDELSTRLLMRLFYTAMQAGLAKAAALREAQHRLANLDRHSLANILLEENVPAAQIELELARLARANRDLPDPAAPLLAHPYYWAGFVLIGDDLSAP